MNAPVQVAVAMLHRHGLWLLQLRDDIEGIIAPGCWGVFGGHLDPGESPETGLRRELDEEIGLRADQLTPWFLDRDPSRLLHVFVGPLPVPIEALTLREGQDLTLASTEQLTSGVIKSPRLQCERPLATSLQCVVEHLHHRPPLA